MPSRGVADDHDVAGGQHTLVRPLLEVRDLVVRFGGVLAVDGLAFDIGHGEICALIGPNGAGKTTVVDVVSRVTDPTSGSVTLDGRDLLALGPHHLAGAGIGRTYQHLALWEGLSVLENVLVGLHATSRTSFVAAALRIGVRGEEARLRERALAVLDELDLTALADHPAAGLPHGTLKRVELARAVVADPRLLLLDEPASGLDRAEVDELATAIGEVQRNRGLSVLLVEHHMGLVMGVAERVVVLDVGRKIADGPPAEVRHDRRVVEAYLGAPA